MVLFCIFLFFCSRKRTGFFPRNPNFCIFFYFLSFRPPSQICAVARLQCARRAILEFTLSGVEGLGLRPRKKSGRTSRKSCEIFCLKKMQKFKNTTGTNKEFLLYARLHNQKTNSKLVPMIIYQIPKVLVYLVQYARRWYGF